MDPSFILFASILTHLVFSDTPQRKHRPEQKSLPIKSETRLASVVLVRIGGHFKRFVFQTRLGAPFNKNLKKTNIFTLLISSLKFEILVNNSFRF